MPDQEELRKQNIAIIHRLIDAINRWDLDLMAELYHADVHREMPYAPEPFPREFFGLEKSLAFSKEMTDRIDSENLHDVVVDTFASDPGRLLATYKSDMEIKPQMTRYRNRYISEFHVRDGKITYSGIYYDPIALAKAFDDESTPDESATPGE